MAEQIEQALWGNGDSDTIPDLKDLLCSGEMERGRLFSWVLLCTVRSAWNSPRLSKSGWELGREGWRGVGGSLHQTTLT